MPVIAKAFPVFLCLSHADNPHIDAMNPMVPKGIPRKTISMKPPKNVSMDTIPSTIPRTAAVDVSLAGCIATGCKATLPFA